MKRIFFIIGLGLLVLIAVLLFRTMRLTSYQVPSEPPVAAVVEAGAADRLASAVQFQTISHSDSAQNPVEAFSGLAAYLEQAYPRVHSRLTREVVGGYSLLYRWQGQDDTLKPILLMAHMDVVPVEPGTEPAWTYPAFSGQIAGGYIWGRGTLDDKMSMMGILEAAEMLLAEGFQPQRTVYLSFGHDEEVRGKEGAYQIAQRLSSRGVEFEFILDEGHTITEGVVPFLSTPVALIGIAEKGYASFELTVETAGGHSSIPPAESAIGILSSAIAGLQENPMPARMDNPGMLTTQYLAPQMPFPIRMAIANQWLFKGVIAQQMAAKPASNANIRSTMAPTIFEAGVVENVLPTHARAVINFRIIPGDTVESVIEHARKTIDDPRVQIQPIPGKQNEASPVSAIDSVGYHTIEQSIRSVYPEVVIAPGLFVGAADILYFTDLSKNRYYFMPEWHTPADLERVHGLNERISLEDYERAVKFFYALLRKSI